MPRADAAGDVGAEGCAVGVTEIDAERGRRGLGNFREANLQHHLLPAGDFDQVENLGAVTGGELCGLVGGGDGWRAAGEDDRAFVVINVDLGVRHQAAEEIAQLKQVGLHEHVDRLGVVVFVPDDQLRRAALLAGDEDARWPDAALASAMSGWPTV